MTLYHSKHNQTFVSKKTFSEYLAILSVWLGFLGIPLIGIFLPTDVPTPPFVLIWWMLCLLLAVAARFGARKSISSVCPWVFVGIVLNLTILIGGALLIHTAPQRTHLAYRKACESNLRALWNEMTSYSEPNGYYPSPDQWCDVLSKAPYFYEHAFVCKSANKNDKGRCHYAMNSNCGPNSPPDTVLLFETKGGWNQFGGPELLTFDNHEDKGANVLFNDGHIEFIKPKDVGSLKWKVESQ